ncbi:MAG: peptidoglycan-binding protein [Blastocatellia bacterium]|nr:peptidoglycan-binding protein [Blastocatellia bacterium]
MIVRSSLKVLCCAIMATALAISLLAEASAQNRRDRYGSRSYNDPGSTVPADTIISMRMNSDLNSKTSRVGDIFTATVAVPVYVNGQTVIPAGAIVEGRVTQVTPARRMSRSGSIAIDFDTLVFPNGSRVGLVGSLTSDDPYAQQQVDDEGKVSGDKDDRKAVFIGGGGILGAIIGGMAGGGKGAAIGGVAGAGAGVAAVLLSKGEEAEVAPGTRFGIQLKQPLLIRDGYVAESDPGTYYPADGRTADSPPASETSRPDYRRDRNSYPTDRQPDRVEPQPSRNDPRPARDERPPAVSNDASLPDESDSEDASEAGSEPLPLSSAEMVRRAQVALRDEGYYEGQIDGQMSPRVSDALRAYQRENNLPETGDLDPTTAKSLGINTAARPGNRKAEPASESGTVLANVLSATARRNPDGGIDILINTQANTGGWRWYGEHVVNGDTLEVYARAVRPAGMVTQVLTRGRIEMQVKDDVEYVRRVVVHGAGGDLNISLSNASNSEPVSASDSYPPRTASRPSSGGSVPVTGMDLQRQAEELLAECQRILGVRLTGTKIELEGRDRLQEPEIELLFAIDSFANSTQLYSRLSASLQTPEALRKATLSLARQARSTDAVFTTTTSRAADALAVRWDAIRQDVLKLMQTYNISSSELDQ